MIYFKKYLNINAIFLIANINNKLLFKKWIRTL